MLFPDLSLTLSQRRRRCVLDPALILSRFGLLLVRRLGEVLELWVPREFWHILDNSQFYLQQPEALFHGSGGHRVPARPALYRGETAAAIKEWERIRLESDLSGLNFFWIGDGLPESLVPAGTGADLVWRYESLASALDRHLGGGSPMACAARDTAALSAALGGAFVLTYQTSEDIAAGAPPDICDVVAHCVQCEKIADDDPIAATERSHLRHLLVHSAAASLLWSGLNLTVLHLAVPAAAALFAPPPATLTEGLGEVAATVPAPDSSADPWDGARAFWYPVERAAASRMIEGGSAL